MPQIDMPLEELKKYQGSSPKPADFEEFWQEELKTIAALKLDYHLERVDFPLKSVECYHLYYTASDGATIHAKVLRPTTISKSILFHFHGYQMQSPDFSDLLHYVQAGSTVYALDVRGQGGLSHDYHQSEGTTVFGHIVKGLPNSSELHFKKVFLDIKLLTRVALKVEKGGESKELFASGFSQGGALALICGALEPRIKKIISGYPFLSDYKRIWDMDWDIKCYEGIRKYLRSYDPLHENIDSLFNTLGYIDIQNFTPHIKGDVLMFTGLMDEICPPSTQFAAYNKLSTKKTMKIYPDFGHERLPKSKDIELDFLYG